MAAPEDTIFQVHLRGALAAAKRGESELAQLYDEILELVRTAMQGRGEFTAAEVQAYADEAFEQTLARRLRVVRTSIEEGAKLGPKASRKTMRAVYDQEVTRAQARASPKALEQAADRIAGRVTVDKVSLTKRMRRVDKEVSAEMAREVEAGVKQKKGILGAAKQIEKLDPRDVRLPKYLAEVEEVARKGNLDELKGIARRYLKRARATLGEMQVGGELRPSAHSLRTATTRFLTDIEKAGPKGIDKVVSRYLKDKAQFRARLIARHETVEAYRRSYIEQSKNKPGVIGMRWQLSPTRHPRPDECFPAGTMVATAHGERPIESLHIGDLVLTHCGRYRHVLRAIRTIPQGGLLRLRFRAATNQVLEVAATPNHPFATARGWIQASDLQIGDQCFSFGAPSSPSDQPCDGTERTCQAGSPQNETCAHRENIDVARHAESRLTADRTGTKGMPVASIHARSSESETFDWSEIRRPNGDCPRLLALQRTVRECDLALPKAASAAYVADCHDSRPPCIAWSNGSASALTQEIPCRTGTASAFADGSPSSTRSSRSDDVRERERRRPHMHRRAQCIDASALLSEHKLNAQRLRIDENKRCAGSLSSFPELLRGGGQALGRSACMLSACELESIAFESIAASESLYNLEVEDDHTYFANGLLVHNCDLYANQNAHGLGPGVYPVDAVPRHPHPACLCACVAVFDRKHFQRPPEERGSVPDELRDAKSPKGLDWLKQNDALAQKILGPTRHQLLKQGVNVLDKGGKPRLVRDLVAKPGAKRKVG